MSCLHIIGPVVIGFRTIDIMIENKDIKFTQLGGSSFLLFSVSSFLSIEIKQMQSNITQVSFYLVFPT